jgi:hypothetical protein
MDGKSIDFDALLAKADAWLVQNKIASTRLSRVTALWPYMANYDMREILPEFRVGAAKDVVQKTLDMYKEAFKWSTQIDTPPTPEQTVDRNKCYLLLKEQYLKANNCHAFNAEVATVLKKTGEEFHELYTALSGLDELDRAQKAGAAIRWQLYGGSSFGPMQMGWDSKDLLKKA